MKRSITADLLNRFGIVCEDAVPVEGGWLNKKWRITTDRGELFVKMYSNKRFGISGLEPIDAALLMQNRLAEDGVLCPRAYTSGGHALQWLDDGTVYALMDFCEGEPGSVGSITLRQLRGLGAACAQMKRGFAALPAEGVRDYPVDSHAVLAALRASYDKRCGELYPVTPEGYRAALQAQAPILDSLTPEFFDRLEKGIAHEDFSPDNMLFDENGVTAILDFDRVRYGFVLHDIGRALLSLAFTGEGLDPARVRAFADGYRQYGTLDADDIADALRITWCIESVWWIQPALWNHPKEKIRRFRDELCWLTEHYSELSERIRGLGI